MPEESHSQQQTAPCPTLLTAPSTGLPIHLAVGMFDGVHLGHQAVIESANHLARRTGGLSAALSFDPHPSRLFSPQNPTRLLMPAATKVSLLRRLGVGLVIIHPFDAAFASIEAADFPAYLKRCLPTLRSICVGENFRYGKKRLGDVESLLRDCKRTGIDLFSAERIRCNGEPISSTRIRNAVAEGRIDEANQLLGYNYFSEGTVVPGRKIGRTIGFPTLNLPWQPELPPAFGVYAVRIRPNATAGSPWQHAVANYGLRPTVEAAAPSPLLEVHTLAPTTISASDAICVEWLHFIRPEQKFPSLEALKAQISSDAEKARQIFSGEA